MENAIRTSESAKVNNSYAKWQLCDKMEVIDSRQVVAVINGEIVRLAVLTWYMSKSADGASPVHCNFVRYCTSNGKLGEDYRNVQSTSGYGRARGYGYCKKSAAAGYAISNSGLDLEHPIDGVGDTAINGALEAIAHDTLDNLGVLQHTMSIINLHR